MYSRARARPRSAIRKAARRGARRTARIRAATASFPAALPDDAPQPGGDEQPRRHQVREGHHHPDLEGHLGVEHEQVLDPQGDGQVADGPGPHPAPVGVGDGGGHGEGDARDQIPDVGEDVVACRERHEEPESELHHDLAPGDPGQAPAGRRDEGRQGEEERKEQDGLGTDAQLEAGQARGAEEGLEERPPAHHRADHAGDRVLARELGQELLRHAAARPLALDGERAHPQREVPDVEKTAQEEQGEGPGRELWDPQAEPAAHREEQGRDEGRGVGQGELLGPRRQAQGGSGEEGFRPRRLLEPPEGEADPGEEEGGDCDVDVLGGGEAHHGGRQEHQVGGDRPVPAGAEPAGHGAHREPEQQPLGEIGEVHIELAVGGGHPPPEPDRPVARVVAVEVRRVGAEDRAQVAVLEPAGREQQVVHQAVPGERRADEAAEGLAAHGVHGDQGEDRVLAEARPRRPAEGAGRPRRPLAAAPPLRPGEGQGQGRRERQGQVDPEPAHRPEGEADPDGDGDGRDQGGDRQGQGLALRARAEQVERGEEAAQEQQAQTDQGGEGAQQVDEGHGGDC